MMANAAAETAALTSWDSVDDALQQLALAEASIARYEAQRDEGIAQIRETCRLATMQDSAAVKVLREQIAEFMLSHEAELDGKRSRELAHGTVSLRRTPGKLGKLARVTWERVLAIARTLPKSIRDRIVETKVDLNRGELRQMLLDGELKDEHRRALGVRIEQSDEVYYEIA